MRTDLILELGVSGQMSNDIGIDDAFEVGLRATEYLRCLAFLIHNLDLNEIDEKEKSTLNDYLMPLGEMIYAFSSQAFWMLDTLERERNNSKNGIIDYWESVVTFGDEFSNLNESKEFFLTLFPNQQGNLEVSQIKEKLSEKLGGGKNAT